MSFSIALSQSVNDYSIKNGRLELNSGSDATVDRVYTRTQTERAEWFLDNRKGVPYYGDNGILGGKKSTGETAMILRREISDVSEVEKINNLTVNKERRDLNINIDMNIGGESVGLSL